MIATLALALLTSAASLRHIYAVGREVNDHFVAAVTLGCIGFYAAQALAAPAPLGPLFQAGMVGIWGLFAAYHRDTAPPASVRWLLAYPSQLAFAYALWAGLLWLLRAPFALGLGLPLWWAGALNLVPLGLSIWGFTHNYARAGRLTRHRVPGLPAAVVQLSDLHASPMMHRRELDALVQRVNALEPALVLITGDLVMPFSEQEHGYLLDALAELQAPTLACPGNHDLPVLQRLRAGLLGAGVTLLVDERAQLRLEGHRVEVVGVNFHWKRAQDELTSALGKLPPLPEPHFRILLAHDPRLGAWVPEARFDLVLSGHTHGGQVAANMFGLPGSVLRLLGVRDQGWWPAGAGRQYVHSGNWMTGFPPRMGVASELAVFEPERG